MSVSWRYPNPFVQPITVGEESIDGLGHANNTAYIVWCETTAWRHSAQLGLTLIDCQRLGRAMAIVRGEYDYRVAARTGDPLSVATWLTASDRKLSLERRFQIVRNTDGKTLFAGRWQLVCIDIASGRPARLPPEFIEVYVGNLIEIRRGTDD
jgi:acyl-CoA thioester hydrolase